MSDYKAFVQFEMRAVENRSKSIEQGRFVADDVEFIHITPPGGNLVVEREVTDADRHNFAAAYDAWKQGLEPPVDGTWIKSWPLISPAQAEELLHSNVRTVEELARLDQQGMQRCGVLNIVALQNSARTWLEKAETTGKATHEIDALKRRVVELEELLAKKPVFEEESLTTRRSKAKEAGVKNATRKTSEQLKELGF